MAVIVGVLLIVGVLIAVRVLVHVGTETDWAVLCIPTNGTAPPSVAYTADLYPNVTLAPCNLTTAVHLPPTTWAAYVHD